MGVASKFISDKLRFLKDLAKMEFGRFKISKIFGGLINIGGPLSKFVFDKVVAVGDSAGQTKITTAGGVVWGGISACLLAKVIEMNLSGYISLQAYEKLWRKLFSPHVFLMSTIRKLLYLGNPQTKLNLLFSLLPSLVNVSFDYDFQFDLIRRMLVS